MHANSTTKPKARPKLGAPASAQLYFRYLELAAEALKESELPELTAAESASLDALMPHWSQEGAMGVLTALKVIHTKRSKVSNLPNMKLYYLLQGLRRRGWIDEHVSSYDARVILLMPSEQTKRYYAVQQRCMKRALRESKLG
ncbi:MAG: hypothetical protein QE279_03565 [Rhodoferax sp.]|nr:hypothetical protein [Rhodoferax sp.]